MPTIVSLGPRQLEHRLDAVYYGPSFLANHDRLIRSNLRTTRLRNLVKHGRRAVYFSTDTMESEIAPESWIPFLTSDDLSEDGFFIDLDARRRVSPEFAAEYPNGRLRGNELLVKVKGPNQITAYNAHAPKREILVSGTIWGAIVELEAIDPHFLVAVLTSPYGATARSRLRTNTNVEFLAPDDLAGVLLPWPTQRLSQKYIGEKVRQAERLSEHARKRKSKIAELVELPELATASQSLDPRTNRVQPSDLNDRLDAKYYGVRAMSVERAAKGLRGVSLSSLGPDVSNGFESREFVEAGRPYATVSEVSSGRLSLDSAPRIPVDVEIPDKATLTPTCVLAVRTGSIGIAVKPHAEDREAVISSHLIRLQFQSEDTAAAVATFLASTAGEILQRKIGYGAVQPQIGQEELLRLPIPEPILRQGAALASLLNDFEASIRSARRLTTTAKLLVEALIEGKVTEAALAIAQESLERGDDSADRALLRRLTRHGLDVADQPPLFPDLDGLYALLAQTKEDQS